MDKSWITKPRNTIEYEQGLKGFIDFAFKHRCVNDRIICPCSKCGFRKWQTRDVIYEHLLWKPFPQGYTFWFYHGESKGETSNVSITNISNIRKDNMADKGPTRNMINDAIGANKYRANKVPFTSNEDIGEGAVPNVIQESTEAKDIFELAKDGEQPLYEGCTKYSKLSFLLKLYHIKCLCGMSDKAMKMILELLQDAFQHAKIPSSFYEANETIAKLGINYDKIHACPNNCMLYWSNKDDEERRTCRIYNKSRWKLATIDGETEMHAISHKRKDRSYVDDQEKLQAQTRLSSEDDAYKTIFGEEHPGHVRTMGQGVYESHMFGATSCAGGSSSSNYVLKSEYDANMEKMNAEINSLKSALAYVMQHVGVSLPSNFPNINQVED